MEGQPSIGVDLKVINSYPAKESSYKGKDGLIGTDRVVFRWEGRGEDQYTILSMCEMDWGQCIDEMKVRVCDIYMC